MLLGVYEELKSQHVTEKEIGAVNYLLCSIRARKSTPRKCRKRPLSVNDHKVLAYTVV